MKQYLLGIYQPDEDPPPPEVLDPVLRNLEVLNQELREAGAWVFGAGLQPRTGSVVRVTDGEALVTDGPFAEGKEHLGGFTIIRAADLEAAREWGRRLAEVLAPLPIEVRELAGAVED